VQVCSTNSEGRSLYSHAVHSSRDDVSVSAVHSLVVICCPVVMSAIISPSAMQLKCIQMLPDRWRLLLLLRRMPYLM
jgi:hypothetical protein